MKYANAGHNPPIVGQKEHYQYLKYNPGFILGCFPDAYVKDEEITLNKGDTITLYTDGITEAMNEQKEQYGEQRLINLFNRKVYSCLLELHHQLKDDVMQFVGEEEQSDDMTYITLKYHGDKYYYEEKSFTANSKNIPHILDYLREFTQKEEYDKITFLSLVTRCALTSLNMGTTTKMERSLSDFYITSTEKNLSSLLLIKVFRLILLKLTPIHSMVISKIALSVV